MAYDWTPHSLQKTISVSDIFTCFTGEYAAGYRFYGEMHDFWELVYVERGSIWVAEEQHVVQLHENMFIIHRPFTFHRLWCEDSGATMKFFTFNATGRDVTKLERRTGVLPWHLRETLLATVKRGAAFLNGNEQLGGCVAAGIEYLLEEIAHTDVSPLPNQSRSDFECIMSCINAHYRENITLAELSAMCHMSESKLKKVFHSVYDLGIMKYLCKLKIRDAGQMLADGYTTEEICKALHFTDRNYFSYTFKRETGMTPREYRQKTEK